MRTRYARARDGVQVAYQTRGEGAIDLLIPSYGNISIATFDEEPRLARFLDGLASFTRLVLFDWRGIGLSDPMPSLSGILDQRVDDVDAVVDALEGSPPAFFGWLLAGAIGIRLAVRSPDRLSALILPNSTARMLAGPGYEFGIPERVATFFAEQVIPPDADQDPGEVVAVFAPSVAADPGFVQWWDEGGRRGASPTTAAAVNQSYAMDDVRELLPRVNLPTLVIQNAATRWFRPGHGRYLGEHIPEARYVELPGADMTPFTENGDAVIEEVEEFLTGERHSHAPDRELATVLFTDIVGSTRRAGELGDQRWRVLLDEHDRLVEAQVQRFRGRVVKSIGDGVLATFDSPARAIRCALAVIDRTTPLGIELRAGIHTGEIEVRGADIGGIAVHLGERVLALAAPGEVLVSRTVADLVSGSPLQLADRGTHTLRGVSGEWQVFAVVPSAP